MDTDIPVCRLVVSDYARLLRRRQPCEDRNERSQLRTAPHDVRPPSAEALISVVADAAAQEYRHPSAGSGADTSDREAGGSDR
jgi:hypothetical protein